MKWLHRPYPERLRLATGGNVWKVSSANLDFRTFLFQLSLGWARSTMEWSVWILEKKTEATWYKKPVEKAAEEKGSSGEGLWCSGKWTTLPHMTRECSLVAIDNYLEFILKRGKTKTNKKPNTVHTCSPSWHL